MPDRWTFCNLPVSSCIMPPERWTPGPIGDSVALSLAALRASAGLRLEGLADLLAELGRRIAPDSLRNSEQTNGPRRRRIDVDDLVALALALNVSPARLLLPRGDNGQPVQLTPTVAVSWRDAWRWAAGDAPLGPHTAQDRVRWLVDNRPHDDDAIAAAWIAAAEETGRYRVERDDCGRVVEVTALTTGMRRRLDGTVEDFEGTMPVDVEEMVRRLLQREAERAGAGDAGR